MVNLINEIAEPTLPIPYPFPLGENGTPPLTIHWARKNRPVCPIRLPSGREAWMLTRKDDIEAILSDARFSRDLTFAGAPRMAGEDITKIPGGLFNLDPPDHSRVRHVLKRFYTPAGIECHRPVIEQHAKRLLDAMAQGPNPTDLVAAYLGALPLQASVDILHIPAEHQKTYLQYFQAQTDLSTDLKATPEDISIATDKIKEFAEAIIATRRSNDVNNIDDSTGALIKAQKKGEISEAELVGTVCYLLITGSDSIVAPLSSGTLTLMLNSNQLNECINNPKLWPKAVEEVVRYHHNSVLGLPRIALEDITMHGVVIRKNDAVCLPMLGATWDPEHYAEPHQFDIHRTTSAAITFGHGAHFCLGASLARMFMQVAYSLLFARFPNLALAVPEREIPWDDATMFIKPRRLPVSW